MLYRHQPRRLYLSAHSKCNGILPLVLCGIASLIPAYSQSLSVKPTGVTGSIGGSVTDPDGNAVVGATVWAIRTFSLAATSAPITATAQTDSNGGYRFTGLTPASYRICLSAEGWMLLDPCTWSAKPPVWNLEGGQAATVNLAPVRGTFIHVRVDDPGGAIAKEEQANQTTALTVSGVSNSGTRVHFMQTVNEATGRTFRALVPIGAVVQMQFATDLNVVNSLGSAVNSSISRTNTTPVAISGSATAQSVRLVVQ
jgi:hypothetical protein